MKTKTLSQIIETAKTRIKGNHPNAIIDLIIIAYGNIVNHYIEHQGFYNETTPIPPDKFITTKLRSHDGLIELHRRLFEAESPLINHTLITNEQESDYRASVNLFYQIIKRYLSSIPCALDLSNNYVLFNPKVTEEQSKTHIMWSFWNLVRIDMLLFWVERETWNKHDDWELSTKDWEPWQYDFDRLQLNHQCKTMQSIFKEYNYNLTWDLCRATYCLPRASSDFPKAFCNPSSIAVACFENIILKILSLPLRMGLEEQDGFLSFWDISPWAYDYTLDLIEKLHKYFSSRANDASSITTKKLWLSADAELIANSGPEDQITETIADNIVSIANQAAKADWIDSRVKNSNLDDFHYNGKIPRTVKMDDTQFNTLLEAQKQSIKPKRTKKYGHEGNGHKGPKTSYMEKQRKTFQAWLDKHPDSIRGRRTKIGAARRCWLEHKKEWDAAAKATGDKRGYSSFKALAASFA